MNIELLKVNGAYIPIALIEIQIEARRKSLPKINMFVGFVFNSYGNIDSTINIPVSTAIDCFYDNEYLNKEGNVIILKD